MPLLQARSQDFHHKQALQIVTTIREVETFITKRKVGNLLIAQRHSEPHPVMERGVDSFV
jgi:hypothetical protein